MLELTFGEQVKVVLNRKGMTIKELAEIIEERTGKKMSRQNLTQRLSRDNFQEQDMRMIAGILGCSLYLSILEDSPAAGEVRNKAEEPAADRQEIAAAPAAQETAEPMAETPRQEAVEDASAADKLLERKEPIQAAARESVREAPEKKERKAGWGFHIHRGREKDARREVLVEDVLSEDVLVGDMLSDGILDEEEDTEHGDVNPYTGREYKTNSVRVHPERIGYVQVYDRAEHRWTDMTEWAFLGYQERKKALLGNDYEPPIYLD